MQIFKLLEINLSDVGNDCYKVYKFQLYTADKQFPLPPIAVPNTAGPGVAVPASAPLSTVVSFVVCVKSKLLKSLLSFFSNL